ncbi:MAG: hypothetical protein KF893_20265 [Caldilineaceae bacterium]|nr:hypothetical protein [Caldilineaceae bacterium]
MTTITVAPALTRSPHRLLTRAWRYSPLLTLAALANLALIPIFIVAAILDPRVITGALAWIKPLKFAISITIFCATFLWMLTFVRGHSWLVKVVTSIIGLGLLIEIALIAMQVVRGTASHFNTSSAFDTTVYSLMGSTITAVSVSTLLLGIWLIRQKLADPVFAWGLRLGVLISVVGMLLGFLMTSPTEDQLAAARAGEGLPRAGAHAVGAADDGPGLPLLGWSTEGGDLRAPHFVGLHAMQILPVLGGLLGIAGIRQRWSQRGRLGLMWTAGLGYLGLTLLLTWQALRGQSIIAPDALTLTAAGLLLVLLLGAAGIILVREQQK